jgi:GcrA cell cycle regulator
MAPTANILGLETHSCRWPIGNPDSHDFGFCGREKTARGSYCDEHARGAFRKLASPSELKAWAASRPRSHATPPDRLIA